MTDPVLTGHCGCGAVRFEISEPLVASAWCHCTRCQHRTGTAMQASAMSAPDSLTVVAGEDKIGVWAPDGGYRKLFCTVCGSALYGENPDKPESKTVRLGSIDGDPGIRPQAHQYVSYKAAWFDIPDDGLPRFPERIGETDPL